MTAGVDELSNTRIPTMYGDFNLHLFRQGEQADEHLAMVKGELDPVEPCLVRVHSECLTGDVMGSMRCDCGQQLQEAMAAVAAAGSGIVLYLRQEGRGIGLLDKLRAYNLQDQGYDTVDANLLLGHEPDERDYQVAAAILEHLGATSIRLLTNNPNKIEQLTSYGIDVVARVPLVIPATRENARYLETKSRRLRHLFTNEKRSPKSDTGRTNGRTSP